MSRDSPQSPAPPLQPSQSVSPDPQASSEPPHVAMPAVPPIPVEQTTSSAPVQGRSAISFSSHLVIQRHTIVPPLPNLARDYFHFDAKQLYLLEGELRMLVAFGRAWKLRVLRLAADHWLYAFKSSRDELPVRALDLNNNGTWTLCSSCFGSHQTELCSVVLRYLSDTVLKLALRLGSTIA